MTDDPFTQLEGAAVQLHELLQAFIGAGFRRREALQLVLTIVSAQQSRPQ